MRLFLNLFLIFGILYLSWSLLSMMTAEDVPPPVPVQATPEPFQANAGLLIQDYREKADGQCRALQQAEARDIPTPNRAAFFERMCACFHNAQRAGFLSEEAMAEAIRRTHELDRFGLTTNLNTSGVTIEGYTTLQAFELALSPCQEQVRQSLRYQE